MDFWVHCQSDRPSLVPGQAWRWQNSAQSYGSDSLSGVGRFGVKEKVCGDVSLDISVCSVMDSVDRDVVTVPVHLGSQNQPGTVERETLSLFPEVLRSQRTVQTPKHLEDFVL